VRWVASRKAAVVRRCVHGLVSRGEVLDRYALSGEELDGWMAAVERIGEPASEGDGVQRYRQP
jgi:hypothetical protein